MNPFPYFSELPAVDTEQMREVDRAMIEDFGIELIQMMENAGRCLAHLARIRFLGGDPMNKAVVVLAGSGGNGGGALVAARRLANYGARVHVFTTRKALSGVPGHQYAILQQMQIATAVGVPGEIDSQIDLIIDGIIGYSLQGSPRGVAADMIRWANSQRAPTLALDVPSGVNAAGGVPGNPAIKAAATLTLALPKTGLLQPDAAACVGELYVADISVPPQLYARPPLNIQVGSPFATSDIVRMR